MYIYWIREITAVFFRLFLCQRVSRNDFWEISVAIASMWSRRNLGTQTFESLFNVHGLLRTCFKIRDTTLWLTKCHRSLGRYHPLVFLNVDFVAKHDLETIKWLRWLIQLRWMRNRSYLKKEHTYEWKILRVSWTGLYQELISPTIQGIKTFWVIDIIYQYAAVGAPVKRNS